MTAEVFGKTACQCAKCSHVWLEELPNLPKSCANRQCRTRKWNEDAEVIERIASAPPPVAELQDTGEPYKKSEQPKPVINKSVDDFLKSLCSHGIYKPLCRRCQAA